MAKNSLSDVIKTIQDGEDGDQAYARLFGSQMKPCTFRRVFAALQAGNETTEVDAETALRIKAYVDDKLDVDEAFKTHCPDFVGPGEFAVAFDKEKKARKAAASQGKTQGKPGSATKPAAAPVREEKPSA